MSFSKYLVCLATAFALASCGGGGGSAGSTGNNASSGGTSGGNTSGGGTVLPPAAASISVDVFSGAGVSTRSISAIEISKVSVILKDATGKLVPGAVVTFSEKGGTLLTISPASKTALTDASGAASVEIRGASSAAVGATTISASAASAVAVVVGEVNIAVTSAPSGGATNPQDIANALNFLDVNPADKSIVLAGSGGNGRSESATLRFRVVDKNNTPVKGAAVTFAVVPANDVTLNIPSGTSDADGVVATTVSSKNVATAVVIKATVARPDGTLITSQSDRLLVTTGTAVPQGFDLSASKYNMNFNLTGDKSVITVRVVDANGNPVADGVPVVFTAAFGAVGSSSQGGCVTVNGGCSVDYIVQDPRPADGQLAPVTASTRLGNGTEISGTLQFRVVNASLLNLLPTPTGPGTPLFVADSCKTTLLAFAGTPAGFPAAAGTTLVIKPFTTDLITTLKTDTLINDQLSSPPSRTPVAIEFDFTKITGVKACLPAGSGTASAIFEVTFKIGTLDISRFLQVSYPAQ